MKKDQPKQRPAPVGRRITNPPKVWTVALSAITDGKTRQFYIEHLPTRSVLRGEASVKATKAELMLEFEILKENMLRDIERRRRSSEALDRGPAERKP